MDQQRLVDMYKRLIAEQAKQIGLLQADFALANMQLEFYKQEIEQLKKEGTG